MKIKVKALFSVLMAVACLSWGQAEPVSNVEDLVTALWDARGTGGTIVLAKGSYDVSGQAMKTYNASKGTEGDSVSHISISRVTLKGETDDPRDTVIYGNGTNTILYCYNGSVANLTISNGCTKTSSDSGGGVNALNDGTVLSNCVITCCKSLGYGGGVMNAKCLDCDICFNTSVQSGGGAYRAHLVGCRIFGNESGKDGGGAHQTKVVGGCRVYGNTAKSGGGGVSNSYSGKAWTYDSTVVSNKATTGGGAYNMVLTNCVVKWNTASNGGGVAYKSEISDSWVNANVATSASGGGGGVYSSAESDAVTVTRCEIAGNFTAGKGGGTYFAVVEDSQIYDNFAGGADGGACYKGSLVGSVVSNNVSGAGGSGLCSVTSVRNCSLYATPIDSVGELVNCRVCGYTNGWVLAEGANAVTNGHFAGQDTLTAGTFAARNTLFADNQVANFFYGYHSDGIVFENCTVAGNRFSLAFYNFGSTAYAPCWIVNSLFAGNKSLNGETDYGATWGSGQKLAFTNCLFASSTSSTNNLAYPPVDCLFSAKPRFDEKNAEEPYSLKRTSPARGAGLVMDWMADTTDVRNDPRYPRLRDGAVDIGCYQCWLDPTGVMLIFR